jgi:carbamate kinase
MRIVVALGGNALLRRGEPPAATLQQQRVIAAAGALAPLAGAHELIITHGNGPQIGLLALEGAAYEDVPAYPLDILGAETQGMIGYLLESALRNALPARNVATLLSQVVVDGADPAFSHPTKPIGPVYPTARAAELEAERPWTFGPDTGGMRRLVPSPEPVRMLEVPASRALLDAGLVVITAGGGGVPMVESGGQLTGVEAVIDKDLTSALLATELAADSLLLLTDVPAVYERWDPSPGRRFRLAAPVEMRRHEFAPGSMGPKVEAACRFAEQTGGTAVIGSLEDAFRMVSGEAGTTIRSGLPDTTWWEET